LLVLLLLRGGGSNCSVAVGLHSALVALPHLARDGKLLPEGVAFLNEVDT
jgi:hypothetical protein